MSKQILVLIPVNERQRALLESKAPGAEFTYTTAKEATFEQVQRANIIIGNPRSGHVKGSPNLGFLQLETAGSEHYTKPGVFPEDALLANATGAYGLAISEYMLGVVLSLMKKLHLYRDQQRASQWTDLGEVKGIAGATVLVVGLGDIGGSFAEKVKALGGYTIGIRRIGTDKPAYLDELHLMDQLDQLLPQADVVALSLPATAETYRLFNRERLQAMKPGAILINVGRGSAVDQDALADLLASGHLGGAGLDVTDPEPLPADHPLWLEPNALLTPHVSGGHHLAETFERIVRISARNLEAFLQGQPIRNLVDFETGYRKL